MCDKCPAPPRGGARGHDVKYGAGKPVRVRRRQTAWGLHTDGHADLVEVAETPYGGPYRNSSSCCTSAGASSDGFHEASSIRLIAPACTALLITGFHSKKLAQQQLERPVAL